MGNNFSSSLLAPSTITFGRRNAARYVGGTVAGESHASVTSYSIGFVLSIVLTAIPFGLVMDAGHYGFTADTVLAAVLLLAVAQVFVHVVYFLHMDRSAEQRWNVVAFAFTVMILVIVVSGSVWMGLSGILCAGHSIATQEHLCRVRPRDRWPSCRQFPKN